MSLILVLPIVIPLATAVVTGLLRKRRRLARAASMGGLAALLAVGGLLLHRVLDGGVLVDHMGGWPAPYGITLVADAFSAVMVLLTAIVGSAVGVFALVDIDPDGERMAFHSFFHALLAGVAGAFLTGDIFNLYVFFEVMLIASFALLVLGRKRAQIDGAVKYVAINLVSTTAFLVAIGLLYGSTGTLNMAELSVKVPQIESGGLRDAIAVLFFVAFGVKAALFPLYFWLPASYHTPPVAVSAVFSGLLTKVGIYAIIRVFTLVFPPSVGTPHTLMVIVAALTMVSGVLGAAAQGGVRRILSVHIVSQIGYILLGLALFTPLALAGAIFYLMHNIVVKTNLFLLSGLMRRAGGSFSLARLGGLYHAQPFLALLFLVSAFSLAGFPPLSGFWAKLLLIRASFDVGFAAAAIVAILVGFMTIYSMTKIWVEAFWKPAPADASPPPAETRPRRVALYAPVVALTAVTLVLGLWPAPFLDIAERAAEEVLRPDAYVRAVLGDRP